MRIKYPKNSKYFEVFNTLIADNSTALETGNHVLLPFSDNYKYQAEEIEIFIDKRKNSFTRLGLRLKPAYSQLESAHWFQP